MATERTSITTTGKSGLNRVTGTSTRTQQGSKRGDSTRTQQGSRSSTQTSSRTQAGSNVSVQSELAEGEEQTINKPFKAVQRTLARGSRSITKEDKVITVTFTLTYASGLGDRPPSA